MVVHLSQGVTNVLKLLPFLCIFSFSCTFLIEGYLPIFFGVVGSPATEGRFGEKLSSVGISFRCIIILMQRVCFGRSSISATDGEG